MKRIAFLLALAATPAAAQQAYAPPDAALWSMMSRALEDVPMSLSAHQTITQILANVQQQATMQAARAKAEEARKAQEPK